MWTPLSRTLFLSALCFSLGAKAPDEAAEVKAVLDRQQEAWNRGDLRAFVASYSDDCVFHSSAQTQRGKQQVLDRYLRRYPNRDAMGKLTFSEVEVRKAAKSVAIVMGRWKLERSEQGGGNVGGVYSLVLQKRKGEWLIIHDHTS
jgi:uncharacterized protein (TIGR02246 family)